MTAGFSKGKKKYYLYYRCIHHTEKNYRGEAMHDQFAELLGAISFFRLTRLNISPRKPDLFLRILKTNLSRVITTRNRSIAEVQKKLGGLTEKYVNDKIDDETYTKFNQRFRKDLTLLNAEVHQ